MKITLIVPFPDIAAIGLRTLSACLKKEGHAVQILFLRKEFWKRYTLSEMHEMTELSKDSGMIGLCVLTNWFENAVQITERLKRTVQAPVVWGGVHPTLRPEECLDHADIVCVGEAESLIVELARRIEKGQSFRDIHNLCFKDRGKITRNPLQPLCGDLDSIPFPDYDFKDHFILSGGKIRRADLKMMEKCLGGAYMLMTTRGCPLHCTYCLNNALQDMDKSYMFIRKRSSGHVIRELIAAKIKLPFIRRVMCRDDAFFCCTEKEIQEFCEGYKKHIGMPLSVTGLHPAECDRAKLSMLVDAGLNGLRMGLQSCSERTLAFYERKVPVEKMIEAVTMIDEFREKIVNIQYDILLDNPWETDDALIETLKVLVKFKAPYDLALFSLTFYPGTELYKRAKWEGLIKDDRRDVYRKYFLETRRTYLNGLFHLLNGYARQKKQLPFYCMLILTSRTGRYLGVSYLLYCLLLLEMKLHRVLQLIFKGFSDLKSGDWTQLKRWLAQNARFSGIHRSRPNLS